jgi:hypothetical protein
MNRNFADGLLGFVLLIYFVTWLQPSAIYWTNLLIVVLAINTIARHLGYAVAPWSLPDELRRTIGNAYISFVAIAIADVCTFVLTFNAINSWQTGKIISLPDLWATVTAIFFGQVTALVPKILEGSTPPLSEVLLPSIGALISFNLLDTAYRFKEFKRTDQDLIAIADANLSLGKYNDALTALRQVRDRGANWHRQQFLALLGVVQVDDACYHLEQFLESRRADSVNRKVTLEEIFVQGLNWLIIASLPDNACSAWIRRGVERKVADVYIAYGLIGLSGSGFKLPDAEPILATPEGAPRYPLSRVAMLISPDEMAEARAQLDQFQPSTLLERLFYLFLLLRANTVIAETSEQNTIYFNQWSERNLSLFSQLNGITGIDVNLSVALAGQCYALAVKFNSAYEESWLYVLNKIKKRLPLDAGEMAFLDRVIVHTRAIADW